MMPHIFAGLVGGGVGVYYFLFYSKLFSIWYKILLSFIDKINGGMRSA
jgi:hypothetical protein